MEITDTLTIMKALSDRSRLLLVQALQQPQYVEELAQRCNLAPSTVSFHLGKLEKAGLVQKRKEQYYTVYMLNDTIFDTTLREAIAFHNNEGNAQQERIDRYREKVLRAFTKGGKVKKIPAQHKKRLIIVEEILKRFKLAKEYSEAQVDSIIEEVCDDYCTIRRSFIDEGMMARSGSVYRVLRQPAHDMQPLTAIATKGKLKMKTRQELKREYKERKKPAGVFQIKNTANGKVYLGSSLNLEGPLNAHKFMLTTGNHRNKVLQQDWNTFGSENFVFEILETVQMKDDDSFDIKDELTLLEEIWLEKLQPVERGYNPDRRIRQA